MSRRAYVIKVTNPTTGEVTELAGVFATRAEAEEEARFVLLGTACPRKIEEVELP